jgi:hypothetical protein
MQVHDFVVVLLNVHVTEQTAFSKCNYNHFLSLNGVSCQSKWG